MQKIPTQPLKTVPSWDGSLPGAIEFATLINTFTDAVLVLNRTTRQAAFANTAYLELVGMSPMDDMRLQIDDLLPEFGPGWSSGEVHETWLHVRAGRRLPVSATATWLDKPGQWILLRFVPLEVARWRDMQKERSRELLGIMENLASITDKCSLEEALTLALDLGSRLMSAESLCVYRTTPERPTLVRFMVHGEIANRLPEQLSLQEPTVVYAPSLWLGGQRTLSEIQQAARDGGLGSLACVPLELNGIRYGLLAAINFPTNDPPILVDMLETLAAHVGVAIQHYLNLHNLHTSLQEGQRLSSIQEAISENSLDGIILLNTSLHILDMNPSAELILGYTAPEVTGVPVENVLIGMDSLPVALRMALRGAAVTPNTGNGKLHRRTGKVFPASVQVLPVRVSNEISHLVLLVRDLSEHEEIRTRTQQLEQRALLGEITAIFAHEVRNPVNNISTGLQLMEMNLPEGDSRRELVERLQNDCTRLTNLMESVLTFSKPVEYRLTPTDPKKVLGPLLERWRPRMTRLNIEPVLRIEDNTPMILADARALDQVFTNLISNALTAMREKGGTLAVRISRETGHGPRPCVNITISDTGPGIPAELRDKIFEPFFTTSPQGTGLGLAITKRIIVAHKGTIQLESFPGGTIFTINLPAA